MVGQHKEKFNSVQFSSVTQSCLTLCDPMDCSTSGLPVHHQLLEFTQTHVHGVGDAFQPCSFPLAPSFDRVCQGNSYQCRNLRFHVQHAGILKDGIASENILSSVLFSSVQFSCSVLSNSLRPHGLQHVRPPCPSPTPGAYSNSCPLRR